MAFRKKVVYICITHGKVTIFAVKMNETIILNETILGNKIPVHILINLQKL